MAIFTLCIVFIVGGVILAKILKESYVRLKEYRKNSRMKKKR